MVGPGKGRFRALKRLASPVYHKKSICNIIDMIDIMANENHRTTRGFDSLDKTEHLLRFGQRQGGGRFVEDDHLGLVIQGAGDGDTLAFTARQVADNRFRAEYL